MKSLGIQFQQRQRVGCPQPSFASELAPMPASHPKLKGVASRGQLGTLSDFIKIGALSTDLANAGHTPYLLLKEQDAAKTQDGFSRHYIYRAIGRCSAFCTDCHVELHSGWFNYPSDAAIYWRSEEQEEQDD